MPRWWRSWTYRGFDATIKAREGVAGRDTTDPRLLVGLWLYACVRGIGAARELARRCEENPAFRWLCGGVTVNHRLLSDFRTDHGAALDALFTQVIASLVDKDVVRVSRISQDGVRVRVSAGAGSFRRGERLEQLLVEARQHVEEVKRALESPAQAGLSARRAAARQRAARERVGRLEAAMAQLPELESQRAATSETANADLRSCRGLSQLTVRGLTKIQCVALCCALAYNVMHFAHVLSS